jgi:hypothetical protein
MGGKDKWRTGKSVCRRGVFICPTTLFSVDRYNIFRSSLNGYIRSNIIYQDRGMPYYFTVSRGCHLWM